MKEKIIDILKMQAYERGHSGGIEEVDSILAGLMWDFKEVLEELETH